MEALHQLALTLYAKKELEDFVNAKGIWLQNIEIKRYNVVSDTYWKYNIFERGRSTCLKRKKQVLT